MIDAQIPQAPHALSQRHDGVNSVRSEDLTRVRMKGDHHRRRTDASAFLFKVAKMA